MAGGRATGRSTGVALMPPPPRPTGATDADRDAVKEMEDAFKAADVNERVAQQKAKADAKAEVDGRM